MIARRSGKNYTGSREIIHNCAMRFASLAESAVRARTSAVIPLATRLARGVQRLLRTIAAFYDTVRVIYADALALGTGVN